jgi:hypothetical protein
MKAEAIMDINLGDEKIIELQSPFTPEELQERFSGKRIDAFGQLAKLFQRPKLDDIEITATQKRFEPFWFAAAVARYVYDRRHVYSVEVAPEVQSTTIYGHELPVAADRKRCFSLESLDHCSEDLRRELMMEAQHGAEIDYSKYLKFGRNPVAGLADLEQGGAMAVPPEVRGSFVVRKLAQLLMKTFQADAIHEERIDVEQIVLFYRPVYAIEYLWKARQKTQVLEFDALTGDVRAEGGEIKKKVVRVLANDALFDIGADAIGTVLPGANIAVKLGRLAARKVVY